MAGGQGIQWIEGLARIEVELILRWDDQAEACEFEITLNPDGSQERLAEMLRYLMNAAMVQAFGSKAAKRDNSAEANAAAELIFTRVKEDRDRRLAEEINQMTGGA